MLKAETFYREFDVSFDYPLRNYYYEVINLKCSVSNISNGSMTMIIKPILNEKYYL